MSFSEFLQYARTSAGINFIIGVALSFLADIWPGYEVLSAKQKRWVMMALCFVIPVAATLLQNCYTVDCLWAAFLAGGAAFFGSQAAHARKL